MSRHPRRSRAIVASAASVAIAGLLSPVGATALTPHAAPAAEGDTLIISEYVEGSSNNKGLELYNTGTADLDLAGYQIVGFQNGSTDVGYTVELTGSLAPGQTHVVAHPQADFVGDADLTYGLQFNGDDAVVLRTTGDAPEIIDVIGVVGEQPDPAWGSGEVTTRDHTLRRMADVCAGDTNPDDAFDPATQWEGHPQDTFGGLGEHTVDCEGEEEPPPGNDQCGDPVTPIGTVQGTGAETEMAGETVTVEGIVVGDFQEGGFDGFFVQDEGDEDPASSDGIFVYAPGGDEVAVGDQVRVTGTAGEFGGKTQLGGATYQVCASGVELPQATELEFPLTDEDYESVEGMHVTFPGSLSILEYYNYGRFGEVVIGTGAGTDRQFQPTALADPGSPQAIALRDHNATHRITLDDGLSPQNPPFLRHPAGGQFTLEHTFRGGDTLTGVTGVLDEAFEAYRVQPTQDATFEAANPRPTEVPDVGEASLSVASFNVLNYFTTLESRGADTDEEFDRQETKIVAALAELDADVVGLIEIENNDDVAVAALTEALNAEVGEGTYDYVETGTIGTDEITTAFIYTPDTVEPVGDFATLTNEDDARFLDEKNRPTLAQTFQEVATGESVTIAVNHLKSKGSSCEDVGDPEDPWAGNCNGVRTDAAEAMVDWLADDPTGTGAENTLVIGDLNAYDKEDPINVFLEDGYSDLLLEHQGEHDYSYVFDGQLGYLDYALANEALADKVTGSAAWKINADEPSVLDYDMTFKPDEQDALFEPNAYRSSDHDPVLVGLQLAPPVVEVDRLEGKDRWETSAIVAGEFGDADTVYLANGVTFPDALTGSAAAVADGAPVLLTKTDALPQDIGTALEGLAPQEVVVLGGPEAVDDTVLEAVAELTGAATARVAGEDRYATAAAVAQERFAADDVDTVYVASGLEFADSLAAGSLAGMEDDPILLSKPEGLPLVTTAALDALDPEHIVVLGGPVAIGEEVYTELAGYADSIERIDGDDRYETAAAIADRIAPSEDVFVASGELFPDALSGAALAGLREAPLLLTRQDHLPEVTGESLQAREPQTVTVYGGPVAVSDAVVDSIEALLTP